MGTFQRIITLRAENTLTCRRFHLPSRKTTVPVNTTSPILSSNTALYIVYILIGTVMSAAQESITAAGFITAKELAPIEQTLEEIGHP